MQTETNTASVAERVIPSPPGGGSWAFDYASWQWMPNPSIPAQAPAEAGQDAPIVTTEQEQ